MNKKNKGEIVEVFGQSVLFVEQDRMLTENIPDGFYKYEVRGNQDSWEEIGTMILTNYVGYILCYKQIPPKNGETTPNGMMFKKVKEYKRTGKFKTIDDFIIDRLKTK